MNPFLRCNLPKCSMECVSDRVSFLFFSSTCLLSLFPNIVLVGCSSIVQTDPFSSLFPLYGVYLITYFWFKKITIKQRRTQKEMEIMTWSCLMHSLNHSLISMKSMILLPTFWPLTKLNPSKNISKGKLQTIIYYHFFQSSTSNKFTSNVE